MANPTKRIIWTCPHCGSDDITWDTTAKWDVIAQKNVVLAELDSGNCNTCDQELSHAEDLTLTADPAEDAAIIAAHKAGFAGDDDDDGCPVDDPDCEGNNGDCHDACEPSARMLSALPAKEA